MRGWCRRASGPVPTNSATGSRASASKSKAPAARVPDNPTSVSVSVHADFGGKPGRKLFDLVSPGEYAAGHVFFEAPPGTHLAPSQNIVLVWRYNRGALHRLHRTTDNGEDSGKATGSSIANSYYLGADVNNLTEDSNGNALQIAVYAEANTEAPFSIVVPEPGDGGHLRGWRNRRRPGPFRRRRPRHVLRPAGRTLPNVRHRRRRAAHHLVGHHDGGARTTTRVNSIWLRQFPRPDTTNLHAIRNPSTTRHSHRTVRITP